MYCHIKIYLYICRNKLTMKKKTKTVSLEWELYLLIFEESNSLKKAGVKTSENKIINERLKASYEQ